MGFKCESLAFIEFIYHELYYGDKVCDNEGIFYNGNDVLWSQKCCGKHLVFLKNYSREG